MLPVPEGRMMLLDLMDHVTRPEFVHAHEWRKGDLVIWDNRSMLHRARPFDPVEPRDMRRTTVAGAGPRSEEPTSELQSLMRTPIAGFRLTKQIKTQKIHDS